MVTTRSKSQKADTDGNAVRNKVTERPTKKLTAQRAEVTDAKSGTSQQQVDAVNERYKNLQYRMVKIEAIVAKTRSSGKYLELDERTYLGMGIFIDTLKKERLKNDPDFAFTREFYRDAMRDFNSLNDDNKAMYIAEAKKRNSMDNDVAASKVVRKALKINNALLTNSHIEGEAVLLYNNAMKNDPDFSFAGDYGAGKVYYMDLNDDDKAPYLAEATLRLVDERAEAAKTLAEFGFRGFLER